MGDIIDLITQAHGSFLGSHNTGPNIIMLDPPSMVALTKAFDPYKDSRCGHGQNGIRTVMGIPFIACVFGGVGVIVAKVDTDSLYRIIPELKEA